MVLLTKLVAIALIIYGVVLFSRPDILKKLLERINEGKNYYILGVVKSIIGLVWILGAPGCSLPGVIRVFGVLTLIGGISIFVMKKDTISKIIAWWEKKPDSTIRMVAVATIFLGVLITAAA